MYEGVGKEGRSKIEADSGVVTDYFRNAAVTVQISGRCVGCITLGGDPFIPVMIGKSRVLYLNGLQPGVFAGWLVEVAMYAEESFHQLFL